MFSGYNIHAFYYNSICFIHFLNFNLLSNYNPDDIIHFAIFIGGKTNLNVDYARTYIATNYGC